ncbi:MAG TPA: type 1 glutamine amidotransferase family protein [Gemmatimonadaceae bacterium]|nr:type 1 glutamine amidotransferase family protein [Gemmatimonadaceae bacterium]
MSDPAVHVLVPEGLADWEPGYAVAGLRNWAKLPVHTVGFTRDPVSTMGGMRLLPDLALAELQPTPEVVRLFLLPGGDLWEGDYPAALLEPLLQELAQAGVSIAAICGATIAVARAGLLRGRRHTSNGPQYLGQFAPGATEPADYVDALATRDRGVITASGLGPVEFAHEIFAELGVFSAHDLATFVDMYKHGRMPNPASPSVT